MILYLSFFFIFARGQVPDLSLSLNRLVNLNQTYLSDFSEITLKNNSGQMLESFIYHIPSEFEKEILSLKILDPQKNELPFTLYEKSDDFVAIEISFERALLPGEQIEVILMMTFKNRFVADPP